MDEAHGSLEDILKQRREMAQRLTDTLRGREGADRLHPGGEEEGEAEPEAPERSLHPQRGGAEERPREAGPAPFEEGIPRLRRPPKPEGAVRSSAPAKGDEDFPAGGGPARGDEGFPEVAAPAKGDEDFLLGGEADRGDEGFPEAAAPSKGDDGFLSEGEEAEAPPPRARAEGSAAPRPEPRREEPAARPAARAERPAPSRQAAQGEEPQEPALRITGPAPMPGPRREEPAARPSARPQRPAPPREEPEAEMPEEAATRAERPAAPRPEARRGEPGTRPGPPEEGPDAGPAPREEPQGGVAREPGEEAPSFPFQEVEVDASQDSAPVRFEPEAIAQPVRASTTDLEQAVGEVAGKVESILRDRRQFPNSELFYSVLDEVGTALRDSLELLK